MSKVTEDATITLNNADSLYLSEQIFTDTTALKTAIASYEKANRKKQYNDDLARLYYYLGRNIHCAIMTLRRLDVTSLPTCLNRLIMN